MGPEIWDALYIRIIHKYLYSGVVLNLITPKKTGSGIRMFSITVQLYKYVTADVI
jgi:hypothetical protein